MPGRLRTAGLGIILGLAVSALLFRTVAIAIHDKDNQGNWDKPTVHNRPDKEVPGFFINMGPTGARAILTENTFVVKYIFKDSPAFGKLKLGDEVTGTSGKPFGKHTFGGGQHGYEGPMMDLGEAIERAEGSDGKLALNVKRGSETLTVTVDLQPLGTFSPTFPFNCKKSQAIRANALKYLAEYPDVPNVWQSHARMAVILALLTSDDSKQFAVGKKMALKWNEQRPDAGTWSWNLSHQLITLSEYHLLTKDTSVLPTMKILVEALEKAQYSGKIVCWEAKPGEDPAKLDTAQQLYDGGFGHAPYVSGVGKNGYGPMQYTTILAVIGWQAAGRCGVETDANSIKRAIDFIHRGTNAAGYVAYGGEFTLNNGFVDSVAWKKSTSGTNYVGRSGCSLVAHLLSPEFEESKKYADLNKEYMGKAYKSMPDGHADANLGIFWGVMGAASSGDDKTIRELLNYHKAYFNMMRCYDGSFVLQPGRDYADSGYYMASRYHPTASLALAYGLDNPKLLIQGIQISLPGVNPKALKGKADIAYKAIVNKNYADATAALKGASTDDAVAQAMLAHIDVHAQLAIAKMEALEKAGDIASLHAELGKGQKMFGLLPSFKEKATHFESAFREEPWKLELRIEANYRQLVGSLRRNKSLAYVGDLERFAARYPDSLYGKWALQVAKEYRASSTVVEPQVELASITPTTSAVAAASSQPSSAIAAVPAKPASNMPAAKATDDAKPAKKDSSELLAGFQQRMVRKLEALLAGGAKVHVWISNWGPKPQRYKVQKASDVGLVVQQGESLLPVPWNKLLPTDRADLAKGMAKEDDVEALLISAVMHHLAGKSAEAEQALSQARLKDAEAARKVKDTLSGH
jgi:hypothetical protein